MEEDFVPVPAELKRKIDDFCQHLLKLGKNVEEGEPRRRLHEFVSSLQDANKDWLQSYEQSMTQIQANTQRAQQEAANLRAQAQQTLDTGEKEVTVPVEDVLPLGLTLRDQILDRYYPMPTAEPGKEMEGSVATEWVDSSASAAESAERKAHPGADEKTLTQKPKKKKGDDIWEGLSQMGD